MSKGNGLGRGPDGDSQLKGRRCPWGSEAPKGRGGRQGLGPQEAKGCNSLLQAHSPSLGDKLPLFLNSLAAAGPKC